MRYAKLMIVIGIVAVSITLVFVLARNLSSISFIGGGAGVSGTSSTSGVAAPTPPRQAPAGYKEYRHVNYHFSLLYQDNLQVVAYDEDGGALTVTFQNVKTVEGFQIFVTPYDGTQISEERFKQDEPSGVRRGAQNVTIDGAQAVSFYSTNPTLGDTAEIWFIYPESGRGVPTHLYEVTTLKSLAPWLSGIMQTWQFI
jgi:hypothetical protein